MENKNQFIEVLLKNYDKFTWTRNNFEFLTYISDYTISVDSAQTGVVIRVKYKDEHGNYDSYNQYDDENTNVKVLYGLIYDLCNKQHEENFWQKATLELSREAINKI